MPIWVKEYPHSLYSSVVLYQNKIIRWKTGPNYWRDPVEISFRGEIPNIGEKLAAGELSVKHKEFVVHNDKEHQDVFQKHAEKWFKQWELHEEYKGAKPY